VDGHLLPEPAYTIFASGRQADVPLITGSVADEASGMMYMADAARFTTDVGLEYGERADAFLSLYPARDDEDSLNQRARERRSCLHLAELDVGSPAHRGERYLLLPLQPRAADRG
jgi:hypothetical protein